MDFKEIVLREIDSEKYKKLELKWHGQERDFGRRNLTVQIVNPMMAESYEELFRGFREYEGGGGIHIPPSCEEGRWGEFFMDRLSEENIPRFARMAEKSCLRTGARLILKRYSDKDKQNSYVGFTKLGDLVVSYHVSFSGFMRGRFYWEEVPMGSYKSIRGLLDLSATQVL